jgi:hypothetical protein
MTDLRKVMDSVEKLSKRFDSMQARRDAAPEWFAAMQERKTERLKVAQTNKENAEKLRPRAEAARKTVKKYGSTLSGMADAAEFIKRAVAGYGLAINNVGDKQKYDEWCANAAANLIEAERALKNWERHAAEVAAR